jgi:hypothetical protein
MYTSDDMEASPSAPNRILFHPSPLFKMFCKVTMSLSSLLLLTLVSASQASENIPRETFHNVHALLQGHSPRPTVAPQAFPRRKLYANNVQARDVTVAADTCGFDDTGGAITCGAGATCTTSGWFAACCTIGAPSCTVATTCINQFESSSLCPQSSCSDPDYYVWYVILLLTRELSPG